MGSGGDRNEDLDGAAVAGPVDPMRTEAWITEPTPPERDAPDAATADPRASEVDASDAELISEPPPLAGEVPAPTATPGAMDGVDLRDLDDLDADGPLSLVDEPTFEFDDVDEQPLWVDPFPEDVDDLDAFDDIDDPDDIADL